MPYGTIKVDNIIFTNGGSDQTVTVSGIVASTSGNLTVTGTISGGTVVAPYGSFTSLTGVTTSGTNANFQTITGAVGVYTTSVSGRAVNALTANIVSGVFASGTAAAPSITFTGNTAAGIYSPGTDQVAISTSGTGRLFVDASGRIIVGASTAAIGHPLEIAGNANGEAIGLRGRSSDGISYIGFYPTASSTENARIQSADTAFLSFHTGSSTTERMRLDSSGRLGLGTSSPQVLNHLSTSTDTQLRIESTSASSTNEAAVQLIRGSNQSAIKNKAGGLEFFVQGLTNEIARFDSSGRLGIGITTPNSPLDIVGSSRSIQFGSASRKLYAWSDSGGTSILTGDSQAGTGLYFDESGHTLRFWTGSGGTERARLTSDGKLLVGTSTARSNFYNSSNSARFQIEGSGSNDNYALSIVSNYAGGTSGAQVILAKSGGSNVGDNTLVSNGNAIGLISFQGADGTEFVPAAYITGEVDGTPGANDMPGRLVFSTTADGAASPTLRHLIASSGLQRAVSTTHVLEMTTTSGAGTSEWFLQGSYGGTAGSVGTGTASFRVWTNGNVVNTNNSYGAISDLKLKENIVDAGSQWDDLKALQVRKYNFKEGQTHTQIGLVAQEAELVSPGLVSESPDRDAEGNDLGTVTKSVNYSVLYMKAVKALQEAMERIEALEADVAQLKGA